MTAQTRPANLDAPDITPTRAARLSDYLSERMLAAQLLPTRALMSHRTTVREVAITLSVAAVLRFVESRCRRPQQRRSCLCGPVRFAGGQPALHRPVPDRARAPAADAVADVSAVPVGRRRHPRPVRRAQPSGSPPSRSCTCSDGSSTTTASPPSARCCLAVMPYHVSSAGRSCSTGRWPSSPLARSCASPSACPPRPRGLARRGRCLDRAGHADQGDRDHHDRVGVRVHLPDQPHVAPDALPARRRRHRAAAHVHLPDPDGAVRRFAQRAVLPAVAADPAAQPRLRRSTSPSSARRWASGCSPWPSLGLFARRFTGRR